MRSRASSRRQSEVAAAIRVTLLKRAPPFIGNLIRSSIATIAITGHESSP
jgi:hypothetical protein